MTEAEIEATGCGGRTGRTWRRTSRARAYARGMLTGRIMVAGLDWSDTLSSSLRPISRPGSS